MWKHTYCFVSYALCKNICSFHKFPPCWWAHVFPYWDPEFQFVKSLELNLNRVYHLLRLRIWCKIRVQATQACIQSDIHNSCWNVRTVNLFRNPNWYYLSRVAMPVVQLIIRLHFTVGEKQVSIICWLLCTDL
jgi:hypothetical protein